MNKILTIGIPVYNMEKYLHRCLKSVTAIKNREACEIIVVNDGSKDRSLDIMREFEAKYPGTIIAIDKPNGGWGSAINRTIEEATGKYYKTLDSDDWFDSENLDRFIEELRTVDADMILSPFNEVDENGSVISAKDFATGYHGQTIDLNAYIAQQTSFEKTIHSIAYRTNMLRTNKFHVWEKFYGDIDYNNTPLSYVKNIHLSPYCIYQYMLGREGQSISVKGYRAHINDYMGMAKKLISQHGRMPLLTNVDKYLLEDSIRIATFAFKLLMKPSLCGRSEQSEAQLKDFDLFLKTESYLIYKEIPKRISKYGISIVSIWRLTGINLYKLLPR